MARSVALILHQHERGPFDRTEMVVGSIHRNTILDQRVLHLTPTANTLHRDAEGFISVNSDKLNLLSSDKVRKEKNVLLFLTLRNIESVRFTQP